MKKDKEKLVFCSEKDMLGFSCRSFVWNHFEWFILFFTIFAVFFVSIFIFIYENYGTGVDMDDV